MSPFPTSSFDIDFVSAITAALLAEYGPILGLPSFPAILAIFTIRPYRRPIIPGSTALQHNTSPVTLMLKTNSQSSRSLSQIGTSRPFRLATPALLTRMSTGPILVVISRKMRSRSASFVRSPISGTPSMALATRVALSADMSNTPTFAPAAESRRQIASPIPCPPPVTTATLPSNRNNSAMIEPPGEVVVPADFWRASRREPDGRYPCRWASGPTLTGRPLTRIVLLF